jgi:hypothetical protein
VKRIPWKIAFWMLLFAGSAAFWTSAEAASKGRPGQDSAGQCPMLGQAQAGQFPGPGGFGHQRGGMGFGQHMEKKRRHLDQLRMLKMLELLQLAPEQEVEFLTAYNHFRQETMALEARQAAKVDSLGEGLAQESLSEQDISRLSQEVIRAHTERGQLMERFHALAAKVLTAEQFGKLVVFHERFEFEILEQLRAFRNQPGPGGPIDEPLPETENP